MKRVKNSVRVLALVVMVCMMLTMGVFAAENGKVWVTDASADGSTVALIMTDSTVTDGVVTLTYDASKLTYEGIECNELYVAMHAVNAEEEGIVKISWVAPGEYDIDEADWLIQVNFSGTSRKEMTLEGTVTGAEIGMAPATPGKPGSPDTGDDNNLVLAIAVAGICVVAIVALVVMKKKGGKA